MSDAQCRSFGTCALINVSFELTSNIQCVGEWGGELRGKQVGSMNEESQVRGCYNITFVRTPTNQETV